MEHTIGIEDITYSLPQRKQTIRELEQQKKLDSPADLLLSFGFDTIYIGTNHMKLANQSINDLLQKSNMDPLLIDIFAYASALPASNLAVPPSLKGLSFFKYASSKLQYDFGFSKAITLSFSQQGCVSLMNAIWAVSSLLTSESELSSAICVSTDVLPSYAKREIIYNAISDAACAVLLKKNPRRNTIVAYHQVSKGYYWDPDATKNEIIASYFPTAKLVIEHTLKKAQLTLNQIDWIIPHNVNKKSWEILLRLLKFPAKRLYSDNTTSIGHTIAADNFINLKNAIDDGSVKKGHKVLLFTFGFGAHWSCMILQH